MNLDAKNILKKEVIGKLNGLPVSLVVTKGGLHLIFCSKNGRQEALGTGPHAGIARWIAEKSQPGIMWTSLRKSEQTYTPEEVAGIVTFALAAMVSNGKA